jgi:glutaredoxin-related protein
MKTLNRILILFGLLFSISAFAQQSQVLPIDSTQKQLLFFSNDGCGKCASTKHYLDKHHMPYKKIAIKENRPLMYEYVHQKTGGKNVGVGYPLLVYGDSIYFSIKNLTATLQEIEEMMRKDGLLKDLENK